MSLDIQTSKSKKNIHFQASAQLFNNPFLKQIIVAFTGGLIGSELYYEKYKGHFDGTNIYLSNSDNDPHIPESRSLETQLQMKKMGANVKLDIFHDRPHTIIEQEIDRAKRLVFKNGD